MHIKTRIRRRKTAGRGVWNTIFAESRRVTCELSKESDVVAAKIDSLIDLIVAAKAA